MLLLPSGEQKVLRLSLSLIQANRLSWMRNTIYVKCNMSKMDEIIKSVDEIVASVQNMCPVTA